MGKYRNSEGCVEGGARDTSWGISILSQVLYIRLLFSLNLEKINHSYIKYEGKVYKFCPWVSRIGIRFVYELLIYDYGSKLVSSPVADTANHSSHVADTVNHSLSLVSLIGSVVEC